MKPEILAAAALMLAATCVRAQTAQEITTSSNTDNVLTYGMSYNQNRFSTLTQINKRNVKRLVPVWSQSLENEFGEQGQPLVYNGVGKHSDTGAKSRNGSYGRFFCALTLMARLVTLPKNSV